MFLFELVDGVQVFDEDGDPEEQSDFGLAGDGAPVFGGDGAGVVADVGEELFAAVALAVGVV